MTIADRQTTIFDYILMNDNKTMLVLINQDGLAFTPKVSDRDDAEKIIEKLRMNKNDDPVRIEHSQGYFMLKPSSIKDAYII